MNNQRVMSLEDALVEVWRQALVEQTSVVELNGARFPVRRTAKKNLCQIDFRVGEEEARGIEQNPETKSRWAQLARKGQRVMQFLVRGRYFANVADGKITVYGKKEKNE
jgi:hypothetical protein